MSPWGKSQDVRWGRQVRPAFKSANIPALPHPGPAGGTYFYVSAHAGSAPPPPGPAGGTYLYVSAHSGSPPSAGGTYLYVSAHSGSPLRPLPTPMANKSTAKRFAAGGKSWEPLAGPTRLT